MWSWYFKCPSKETKYGNYAEPGLGHFSQARPGLQLQGCLWEELGDVGKWGQPTPLNSA